jgi:hypothetical protein
LVQLLTEALQFLAIVILCILVCITYGVLHDQITARICVEYFTVGHPIIIETTDPTILGCLWGVIATWWVGVLLGVPLAIVARAGKRPKRSAASLLPLIGILFVGNAVFAALAGCVGYIAATNGWVRLSPSLAERVPLEQHVPFLVDLWAHNASYIGGLFGGITVMERVWKARKSAVNDLSAAKS